MSLNPNYVPEDIEPRLYDFWLSKGYFKASAGSAKKPYVIVIPPPNVTGVLHIGHGLNNTIQDILVRWKRMSGFETLWLPGTDHAGIATQNVVEKKLKKELKMSRHQIGREKFLDEVWKWKEQNGSTIIRQLKRLGCSCDWDRERFTMDAGLSDAVKEVFVSLHEKGLVYKGEYIINWCPRCGTALSDEEVIHKEKEGGLYRLKYPVKGSPAEFVIVATTRPETMLGDTAVAVNPSDERYKHLKGKVLLLPLTDREIPVIEDDLVDKDFGTGCVKVTPAHDPNDFIMARRHDLPFINILTPDAKMNENVPDQYRGLDRFDCRKKVIEDLKTAGLFQKQDVHRHAVGHCERCDTVVEPYLSKQWFVKMKPLAEPAIKAVESGEIVLTPERWRKVYLNWMRNIRDWCISRQLWWGHRIPAWYCGCGEIVVARTAPEKCPKCGGSDLRQDEDVLDTWFSSWLWPFSTLGWPGKTKDLAAFYPTTTLVTDPGIIFFWVARMIMAGFEFMGKKPFSHVFFNGTVMDSQGRKMSKSLGNGIDPLTVIAESGADALRYTLTSLAPAGENVLLSIDKFQIGRHFANKVWNAAKFTLSSAATGEADPHSFLEELSIADRWMLTSLETLKGAMAENFEKFEFNGACQAFYKFFWNEFCDWYIEISKVDLNSGDEKKKTKASALLLYGLRESMKLLHPVMPFITEEIWQNIPGHSESIMTEPWPERDDSLLFPEEAASFGFIVSVIYNVRNIRGELGIEPSKKISIYFRSSDPGLVRLVEQYADYIRFLAGTTEIAAGTDVSVPEPYSSAMVRGETEVFVPLRGNVDLEKEKQRLDKEISKLSKEREKNRIKLANPAFAERAPKEVVDGVKAETSAMDGKIAAMERNLKKL